MFIIKTLSKSKHKNWKTELSNKLEVIVIEAQHNYVNETLKLIVGHPLIHERSIMLEGLSRDVKMEIEIARETRTRAALKADNQQNL